MAEVNLNGRTVVIERFTLAKAVRVITLLTELQKQVPELTKEWATFARDYARDYAVELDRVQALVQNPDRVVYGADDNPVQLSDGSVVTVPSAVSKLTDEDWERAGHVYRVPASPSQPEVFMRMAPVVFEKAQEPALRLLSLIAMDNAKVGEYAKNGSLYERLDEFGRDVLEGADIAEIMELVAVAAEVVDSTIMAKARTLGKRLRPLRAMIGLSNQEETTTLSEQPVVANTVTSTGSPESSDGTQTGSLDSPGISSVTSSSSPTESAAAEPTEVPA